MNTENLHVETLTINELAELFRRVGISVTSATLADAIEQGVYPFAICIRSEKSRVFQIFKRQVMDWLLERAKPSGMAS